MKTLQCVLVSLCLAMSFVVNATQSSDPLEGMNRKVHSFNNLLDSVAFKPLAKGYKAVTPDIVEVGVKNFFANIGDIGTFVNNVLQFKIEDAAVDLARIGFNSTVGLAGLLDVASGMGLEKHSEDFGQTLGVWGVSAGPYLVLPFLGPGSLRDSPASFVPLDGWRYIEHIPTRNVGYATRLMQNRAEFFSYEEIVTGDNYLFIRDAYLGIRQHAVNDGVVDEIFNEDDF